MPNPQFDSKIFNGEVFQKYVDRVPNLKLNELLKSRAIVSRQDLAGAGSVPLNYDGVTNITSQTTQTFSHSRVVAGRAQAWTEKDFSYDITGGVDFMENVAQQVAEYWDEVDQATIVAILTGVFSMSDTEGARFVSTHTHDITTVQNSNGDVGFMDGTTVNTAIQKACGDHKSKRTCVFSLTCCTTMRMVCREKLVWLLSMVSSLSLTILCLLWKTSLQLLSARPLILL